MGPGDVMFGNFKLYRENFTKGAEIKRAKKEEGKQQTAKKERDRETESQTETDRQGRKICILQKNLVGRA